MFLLYCHLTISLYEQSNIPQRFYCRPGHYRPRIPLSLAKLRGHPYSGRCPLSVRLCRHYLGRERRTGNQRRANVIAEYGDKPQELKNLLTQHKLSVPVFSSGNINVNPQERQAHLDKHLAHARFVKALDGKYLQLTNNARPKDRQPTTDELRNLGKLMGEIGKRTADLDITVVYHNHMHQLGETPEEVDIIMEAADPAAVKLLLDIAHYHQGGGDPAKAMRTYGDRVAVMHLKDVESPVPDEPGKAYRFVELGRGRVDLPAVFAAMKEKNFRGWAVIELDSVPDKSRTPLESARISKEYLNQKMNFRI
jgi:inosose dehydratase